MLVENNADDASLVEIEFSNRPELVLRWVQNGKEAMNYLEGHPPYDDRTRYPFPDVILLDLKMPRVGGFEFLDWLHRKPNNGLSLIPVIVMSGSVLEEDIKQAHELGANGWANKPADWNEFREEMARVETFCAELVELPDLQCSEGT